MENKKSFNILSIDGGGIRGIIPAKVLEDLEKELQLKEPGKKLYEHFDLICGTSTGSILAISIALGIPASEITKFYKENASLIFPKWYLKVVPQTTRILTTTVYNNRSLKQKLLNVFSLYNEGKPPLINDLKTKVCIPVFNGATGEVNVLKTRHHKDYHEDFKIPAHEAALSSSSAPIYFPPNSFSYSNEFGSGSRVNMIDGGVFANNPSIIGILEAIERLDQKIENIKVLSLGTGRGKHVMKTSWKPKNIWYWLIPNPRLLDIILDSQAQITEKYMAFLQRISKGYNKEFGYLRVQYDLGDDKINLNTSNKKEIQRLETIGSELSKNNISDILKFIKQQ